jgi:hypothetical protein
MFLSDSQSQLDYGVFGDVVVFDSTYRVSRYNLPFVPFIGVGHHHTTVVFGCGILSDETASSYIWLLNAFLKAMLQQQPYSLITDGMWLWQKQLRLLCPWQIIGCAVGT